MGRKKQKRKKYNIQQYLLFYAVCFILPIIFFMAVSNIFAVHLMMEKVVDSVRNTVVLYAQYLDEKMNTLDNYLVNLGMNNIHFSEFASSRSESQILLAGTRLNNQVKSDESLYESILEGIFFYRKEDDILMKYTNAIETFEQQKAIEKEIRVFADEMEERERAIAVEWFAQKIEDRYYVFRMYSYKGVYYGSWCNVEKILANLMRIQIEASEKILLLDSEGIPLSSWKDLKNISAFRENFSDNHSNWQNDSYILVSEPIWNEAYFVTVLIRSQDIEGGVNSLILNMMVLIPISVVILFVSMNFTKRRIGTPLKNLSFKMKQVEKGDLTVTLSTEERIQEFSQVNQSFNHMVQEIKHLRIQVYEEIVQRQKTELEFLRIQIRPHFFVNALNLIFNYARMDDISAVKAITLNLVRHFRYTLYGRTLVPIKEEISFIHNYLEINKWKNRDSCSVRFTSQIPEELQDIEIPILAIQTFVENSIKFGEDKYNHTEILVRAERMDEETIIISIFDDGKGFMREMLDSLNRGEGIVDKPGTHVGIENVRNRLKILYGKEAALHFYNREEGGAAVEIRIVTREIKNNEFIDS